ncbi:citron Rho-interacting kinase-like isoform X2 [Branchiostoma lanceolatum]|uniref:citron Rho-interacting kinase-like isoform X2 n=1 Tax=Branchiostoma lanceolatum TaxID=7740 RepID=UPI0034546E57
MEMERDSIEQMVDYQRGLELERNHLAQTDDMKAISLLEEVQQQGKLAQELQEQKFKAELNAHLQTISQLKHDRFVAARRAKTLETELRQEQDALEASKQKVAELQTKVTKLTADSIAKTSELQEKGLCEKEAYLEKERALQTKIKFLENKLKMAEAKQCVGEQEAIRLRKTGESDGGGPTSEPAADSTEAPPRGAGQEVQGDRLKLELKNKSSLLSEKTEVSQLESSLKVLNIQQTEQTEVEIDRNAYNPSMAAAFLTTMDSRTAGSLPRQARLAHLFAWVCKKKNAPALVTV